MKKLILIFLAAGFFVSLHAGGGPGTCKEDMAFFKKELRASGKLITAVEKACSAKKVDKDKCSVAISDLQNLGHSLARAGEACKPEK